MSDDKPNRIMLNQSIANNYHLRLARPITEIDDFEEEFQLFAAAGENDVIRCDIVTPGGNADTAHMLRRAIYETQARTVAYIGPTCASAGTAIALAFDEWEIDELSSFMIHTASYGYWGSAPHIKAFVDHSDRMVERFVRSTYTGFLSEEEIVKVLDGKEVYFDGDELAQRLSQYGQYRDEQRKTFEEEGLDEIVLEM